MDKFSFFNSAHSAFFEEIYDSFLKDPDLVGHLFAAPYAIFDPDLCFVLVKDSVPSGYILGARDSIKFYEKRV